MPQYKSSESQNNYRKKRREQRIEAPVMLYLTGLPPKAHKGQKPPENLVILRTYFEETRELFWNVPRNFEPQSDDEDNIGAGSPFAKLPHHTSALRFIFETR
ncbi:hypothetical protein AVEN_166072-1 [Araneus ventricosus]|uniref:Uncharacterized protein n=1 Tax=Araneus ventricosus TaxID=182803 RepID=A0A4Y2T2Z3_ARAVE|nr:hypothetical protein AVEN_166072-1 [Araneus ventricosus]